MLKRFLFFLTASFGISQMAIAQGQDFSSNTANRETGYFNTTELNFARGFLKENKGMSAGLQTINGYRFNHHISAGFGVGVDQYFYKKNTTDGNNYERSLTFLPVFSDVRIYFGKGNTQPYFSQAVGYAFCVYQPDRSYGLKYNKQIGGLIINPSFGITTPLSEKTAINISLGYRFQEFTTKNIAFFDYNYSPIILLESLTSGAHYINLKAGLTF